MTVCQELPPKVIENINVKHTVSEDIETNSESSESEVIWVTKPVTLQIKYNNVQNTSSVGHNTQRNSSVEQMVVHYHLHITEKSRQRSGLDNPSTVDPGYQIQDSGSFYYNTISSENSTALLDYMSQNWESSQSTIL